MQTPKLAHLIKLVTFQGNKTGWRTWLATACILLLVAATTAQAVHLCGVPALNSGNTVQLLEGSSGNGSPVCLTCLMAQTAAVALFFLAALPTRVRNIAIRPPQARPRTFLDSFHLYVRPPPAF